MRKTILGALLFAALSCPLAAAPLQTAFFTWDVPEGWTVSRNSSGLWQVTAPGPEPLQAEVVVARLSTTPELYLKATGEVWKTQGTVEALQPWLADRPNQAWFLVKHFVKPGETPTAVVKWVRWRGPFLVVTSFQASQESLSSWAPKIRSLAADMKLTRPVYRREELLKRVNEALTNNDESRAGLADSEGSKLAMNSARQDWEAFFGARPSEEETEAQLYRAYLGYLEARFDASFAIEHGPELGIGEDVVESRLRAVAGRREELRRAAAGF